MAAEAPVDPVRVVGRYALYDPLAAGGMATVHYGRLRGPVGFARTVAIKRLHPELARDPEFVSMFLDEARLAARIRHPNVVQTLDVVAEDGELFLIMEYVQGESLWRLLRSLAERKETIPHRMVAAIMSGADPERYRMPVIISSQTYAFAAAVTMAAGLVSALLVRRKLDRLDLIGVLKTRE